MDFYAQLAWGISQCSSLADVMQLLPESAAYYLFHSTHQQANAIDFEPLLKIL
jgi:hypothetical protein